MQEGGEGQWKPVKGASGLSRSTAEFKVTDLKVDKSYRFRMDMRRPGQQNPVFVLSEAGTSCQRCRIFHNLRLLAGWKVCILLKMRLIPW